MKTPIEAAALGVEPAGSDNARLAAGASINLAGKAFSTPLRFITQVLLARWLGKEAYGLYAIGWTLLSMVQTIAPLGVDRGVVRFLPRYWRRDPGGLKSVIFEAHGLALLAGLGMGAATFLAAPWLANAFFQKPGLAPVLRLFALAFPLQSLLVVATMTSRAIQRMKFAVLSQEVVQPAVNLALAVLLLVDRDFDLSARPDLRAAEWIRNHVPPDAFFLINGLAYNIYGTSLAGDAGSWLPYLTGRGTAIPAHYAFREEADLPEYNQAINQLVRKLASVGPASQEGLAAICAFPRHITHVYLGQRQGRVFRALPESMHVPQPLLPPQALLASPAFRLIYHQDRVYIFEFDRSVCAGGQKPNPSLSEVKPPKE